MKQTVIRTLMLFSSLILLAFTVLPHHHHDEGHSICFSFSCCEELAHEHEHDGCDHNHNEDDCNLPQYYLLSNHIADHACHADDNDHDATAHLGFDICDMVASVADFHSLQSNTLLRRVPYVEPLLSKYAGSVRALRAPPIFIA